MTEGSFGGEESSMSVSFLQCKVRVFEEPETDLGIVCAKQRVSGDLTF